MGFSFLLGFLAAIIGSLIIFSVFKLLSPIKLLANKKEPSEESSIYSKKATSSIITQEIYFSFEKLTEGLGSSQLLTELRNPEALQELCLKGHSINNRGIYELVPELSKLPKLKKLTMDFCDIAEAQLLQYLPKLYKLEQLEALSLIGLDAEGAGRIGLGLNNFPRLTFLQIGAYIDASAIKIICKSLEEPQCKIIECNVNYGVKNYNQEQVDRAIAARIAKASKPTIISCSEAVGPKGSELASLI